ncbi:MAG: hypothetical protein J4F45_13075 [Pseudomonadales bacterium]|nr:hypothetical protein [Pseudomonadales bacterium]
MHVVASPQAEHPATGERQGDEIRDTVGVQIAEAVQQGVLDPSADAEKHRRHALAFELESHRVRAVESERNPRREGLGLCLEAARGILPVDLEVVPVPEHEIRTAVAVVVHPVDATEIPGQRHRRDAHFAIGLGVAVGPLVEERLGGTELHRFDERTVLRLRGHPEAVGVGHHEVVAPVPVQVSGDVQARKSAFLPGIVGDRHRDQPLLAAAVDIETAEAAAAEGQHMVAPVDIHPVDEQHVPAQRPLAHRIPVVPVQAVQRQLPLATVQHIDHGEFHGSRGGEGADQQRLMLGRPRVDLVEVEQVVRRLDDDAGTSRRQSANQWQTRLHGQFHGAISKSPKSPNDERDHHP